MLNVNLIRENPEAIKAGIAKKNIDPKLVDKFLRLDVDWRSKTEALGQLNGEQNTLSKELAKKQSEDLLSKAQLLKKRISDITVEENKLSVKRDEALEKLPNIPFEDVPVGKDASQNVVLREVGEKPIFDFKPKDHLALGEALGIIDVKRAAEVAGARFNYLLGDGAMLEFALVQFAVKTIAAHGFTPVLPPMFIKPQVLHGMGRLASDQKEERYYLPKDEQYLIGSAEHTLGPLHMDEVLSNESLPKRYVGFSSCFRREAGSYGKDMKGILRVHQFDKVEMFIFSLPEKSDEEHQLLLSIQEELVKKLELPYRVVQNCTGDMGWVDAKQFDVETWLPGQDAYRETHSCSNTTDFQSSGINAKYKTAGGKKEYLHLLNATGIAIGRMIIAILENNQTKEGTVKIPKVLQEFMGKEEIGARS
ncbi:MAG: serine--tRNA ligase [Candidatus Jorgensenbacteria bacterium]|nr:serine--tRNA ligase [Candidatus Jorgensenbacteria bacterium]